MGTRRRTERPGARPTAHRRYLAAYSERNRTVELEDLVARSWPPRSVLELDGWRLRAGRELPSPASTAWPRADGGRVPLRVRLEGTRRFYADAGLPARVHVSAGAQPRGLDAALAEAGWVRCEPTQLRTLALPALHRVKPAAGAAVAVRGGDEPSAVWLEAWARLTGRSPRVAVEAAATVLPRVPGRSLHLIAEVDGQTVAVARGVLDGGWLGVADLALPADGIEVGAALLRTLADWAAPAHVEQVWWPVAQGEAASDALARRAGARLALRSHLRRWRG